MPFYENTSEGFQEAPKIDRSIISTEDVGNETNVLRKKRSIYSSILGTAVNTVPNFIDSTLSSLTFGGIQRDTINNAFANAATNVGLPAIGQIGRENRGVNDLISGVASIALSELAITKLASAAQAGRLGSTVLSGSRILGKLEQNAIAARGIVDDVVRQTAERGILGNAIANAAVPVGNTTITFNKARNNVLLAGAVASVPRNVASELGFAALQNQNSFFFDEDVGTNIAFGLFGVGIGAGARVLQESAAISKFVNADNIATISSRRLDPGKYDEIVNIQNPFVDRNTKQIVDNNIKFDTVPDTAFTIQDATVQLLQANSRRAERLSGVIDDNRTLQAFENLEKNNLETAFKDLDNAARQGLPQFPVSRINIDQQAGIALHIREIAKNDPLAFHGTQAIFKLPEGKTYAEFADEIQTAFDTRVDNLTRALDAALQNPRVKKQTIERLQHELLLAKENQNSTVLVARDKEFVSPIEYDEKFAGTDIKYNYNKIDKNQFSYSLEVTGKPIELYSAGGFLYGDTKIPYKLKNERLFALYEAGDKFADTAVNSGNIFNLTGKPDAFQIDIASEIIERNKGNPALVNIPSGITFEQLQIEGLAQKAEYYREIVPKKKIKTPAGTATIYGNPTTPYYKIREILNLPQPTAYERSFSPDQKTAIEELFSLEDAPNRIRNMTLNEIKEFISARQTAQGFVPPTRIDLRGNTFKRNTSFDGKGKLDDFLVLRRSFDRSNFTRAAVETQAAIRKYTQLQQILRENSFISRTANDILSTQDFITATEINKLFDLQNAGLFGAKSTAVQSVEWLFRDNPVILAAQRIRRLAQVRAKNLFETAYAPVADLFVQLRGKEGETSKFLASRFITESQGWRLSGETVQTSEGKITYLLDTNDKINIDNWFARYKKQIPPFAVLSDARGVPVELDANAHTIVTRLSELSKQVLHEQNILREARGFARKRELPFYIHTGSTEGKFVKFIIDPNTGDTVQRIVGKTQAQVDAIEKLIVEDPDSLLNKRGWVIREQSKIIAFNEIYDKAARDYEAPVVTYSNLIERTGAGVSPIQQLEAVADSLRAIKYATETLGNDLVDALFDNTLLQIKQKAKAAAGARTTTQKPGRTIYDYYEAALRGYNPANDKAAFIGRINGEITSFFNLGIQKGSDALYNFFNSGRNAREFERLKQHVGNQIPFDNVDKYLAAKFATRRLTDSSEVVGAFTGATATIFVRFMEATMALTNVVGLIGALPAVTRQFTVREGETAAEAAIRNGYRGSFFQASNGKVYGGLNMAGLIARGFKKALNPSAQADYAYMVANGMAKQSVAELNESLAVLTAEPGKFKQFVFGDPTHKGKTKVDEIKRRGLIGTASFVADESENLVRSAAHFIGLELADMHGIKNKIDRHTFAFDFANRTIANYDPLNRPEIFQHAPGAVLGLFTSYIHNYYGRVFRSIENKDYKSTLLNLLGQGSVFGLRTVPGFDQISNIIFENSNGENDVAANVYGKLGPGIGDIVFNGLPSNIPQFAGLEGFALYQRGDTNIRIPGIDGVPTFAILQKLSYAIGDSIQLFADTNPGVTPGQISEVVSRHLINRPLSGIVSTFFADGPTDNTGRLIAESGASIMGDIYRVLGTRSLSEGQTNDAYYRNKRQNELQHAVRVKLAKRTREALRNGNASDIPNIFNSYISAGGDPSRFNTWLKDIYESAKTPRDVEQLNSAFNDPDKADQVNRLLSAKGYSVEE